MPLQSTLSHNVSTDPDQPWLKPLKTCAIIKPSRFKSWCVSGICCSNRKLNDTPIASKVSTNARVSSTPSLPTNPTVLPQHLTSTKFSVLSPSFSMSLSPTKPPLPTLLQSHWPLYCSLKLQLLKLFWKSVILIVWCCVSLISACRRLKHAALDELEAGQGYRVSWINWTSWMYIVV